MLCGLYENDITPQLGANLPGYFVFRPASGVRDRLFAKAAAFTDERGEDFLLISLDAVTVDAELTARTRERASELTGVAPERIMLSATHTHTGGPVDDFVPGSRDADYVRWLSGQAADAAALAYEKRVPARLGYGRCAEDRISFVRRYRMKDGSFATNPGFVPERIEGPAGAIDPEVSVVKIEDLSGRALGAITNFACHPDTVGGNRFCADYPGELSRALKAAYGPEVVSVFLNGACANINHFDFMGRTSAYYREADPPHYVRMGRMLAGDVLRVLPEIETRPGDTLAVQSAEFSARIRTPDPQSVQSAQSLLRERPYAVCYSRENGCDAGDEDLTQRHYARSLLEVAALTERTARLPVQAVRLGKVFLLGLPCELFVEFGLDIKARAQVPVLISTLTNAQFGYIAVREAHEQGGYETTISGDTMMDAQTGYDMADTAVRLIQALG